MYRDYHFEPANQQVKRSIFRNRCSARKMRRWRSNPVGPTMNNFAPLPRGAFLCPRLIITPFDKKLIYLYIIVY